VRPAAVPAMAGAVAAAIAAGPPGPVADGLGSPALAGYDRRRLVARLAGVVDDVLRTPASGRPRPAPAQ
jgi:hypothetical protein